MCTSFYCPVTFFYLKIEKYVFLPNVATDTATNSNGSRDTSVIHTRLHGARGSVQNAYHRINRDALCEPICRGTMVYFVFKMDKKNIIYTKYA